MNLPQEFLARMAVSLGDQYPAYLAAMAEPVRRALRVNTLKLSAESLNALFSGALLPCLPPDCFYLPDGHQPGHDPLHLGGLYYMQEPSAQMPVRLLNPQPGEAVLDLCAAPGGKSGQIAQALSGDGLLISNEIVPQRAQVLARNLERLGVRNAIVTCMHPEVLIPQLKEGFDAVLVDAPCSGEGMFRRDETAILEWSPEHVTACAQRQLAILNTACGAVRPGGRLVYSTCTFSPEENEQNVRAFLAEHPQFSLVQEQRCYPHTGPGEGQYAALLVRDGQSTPALSGYAQPKVKKLPAYEEFISSAMRQKPYGVPTLLADGRVFLFPGHVPAALLKLRTLATGVLAGEIHGTRFEPAHALYLAYPGDAFRNVLELNGGDLSAYLAGEAIPCSSALKGYVAVLAGGHPIGFGKASGGMLKNHLPKGLRIREHS